mmetsp:Transcript_1397/g.2151  ORF Transcript_1397/g.2151 Transcript_1397/m.2151 type:complete len:296 (+) Transcript_1397:178-1065(+)
MAYWDIGPPDAKETLLLTHGEPSWSFLYRRMIDPLLSKGYRVVLFDQVGFGWSDKPSEETDYTYERHVAWNEDLLWNHLNLDNLTAVFQDWGGILGLRVAARSPNRYKRLVLTNTVLPTCDKTYEGSNYIGPGFYNWKNFVRFGGLKGPGKIGKMMSRAARGPSCGPDGNLSKEDIEGYQAPFPNDEYLAGANIFPELVPTPPDDATGRPQPEGGEVNRAMWNVYENWTKPVLLAFSDGDPVLGGAGYIWEKKCPGCKGQPHVTLKGAGHFSQDGGGNQLTKAVINFIERNQSKL